MVDDMSDKDLVIAMFLSVVVGVFAAFILMNKSWESTLIDRRLAIYCPVDGHFAFKGECEK
jgi:hypothetical protein